MWYLPTTVEKCNTKSQRPRRGECGQAMLEYALLVLLVLLVLVGVTGAFMGAIGDFYMNIVKVVALPFP